MEAKRSTCMASFSASTSQDSASILVEGRFLEMSNAFLALEHTEQASMESMNATVLLVLQESPIKEEVLTH